MQSLQKSMKTVSGAGDVVPREATSIKPELIASYVRYIRTTGCCGLSLRCD